MQNLILSIKKTNYSLIGPGSYINAEWKIFDDFSIEINATYKPLKIDEIKENKINKKSFKVKISSTDFNNIVNNINKSKEKNIDVSAYDGDAWEFIQYNNGNEIWKKEKGYIYGIKPLEEITTYLNKLIKI